MSDIFPCSSHKLTNHALMKKNLKKIKNKQKKQNKTKQKSITFLRRGYCFGFMNTETKLHDDHIVA